VTAATVFVIDDDLSVRRSLQRLLVSAGYDVVLCGSAQEFLGMGDVVRPACLLTDVRMPGMTGLDLLELLRSSGRSLPMILSTGHADPATAARARAGGAVRFLSKPFDVDELLEAVQQAIEVDSGPGSAQK
jgi:FixJ family two-component response regulator